MDLTRVPSRPNPYEATTAALVFEAGGSCEIVSLFCPMNTFYLLICYDTNRKSKLHAMLVSHSIASSDEEPEKRPARIFSVPKHLQIALAFTTVFFPLVSVATILCLFVTIPSLTITNPPEDNANLPVPPQDQYFFFTTVFSNKFTLASSFASNIAQFAAAPFLLLFSFLVALDLAHRNQAIHQDVPKLLRGDQKFLCKWAVLRLWRSGNTEITIGTRIAGMGASISLVLTYVLVQWVLRV
jgi:hypothetical protein